MIFHYSVFCRIYPCVLTGYNCKKKTDDPASSVPVITTTAITGITSSSATSGGNVTSDGNETVTARGVCWSTLQNPTITDSKSSNGTGTGTFTSSITELTNNTLYYVRAYATNSVGTSYGNQLSFTAQTSVSTVTDIDGNVYNIVTIGTQVWTKENLKVLHYRNGDAITNVTDNTAWGTLSTEAYCWYNNDNVTNGSIYGALYNYYAITDYRNICPVGWHVPTASEWNILEKYLDSTVDTLFVGSTGTDIGGKLKEADTIHWTSPNVGATNSSGFTGLPGGYRYSSGIFGTIKFKGLWWTSSQVNLYNASYRYVSYDFQTIMAATSGNLQAGYSVRLIKD